MVWQIVFKNTGPIPAWMKVEERKCFVIVNQEQIDCGFHQQLTEVGVFLMSQGEGTLQGDLGEPTAISQEEKPRNLLRGYPETSSRFRRPLFDNGILDGARGSSDGALTGCY